MGRSGLQCSLLPRLTNSMPFPEHIERIFEVFGIRAETKAALFDLFISMGDEVLEVFGDIAESVADPTMLEPEDCGTIRRRLVERYLMAIIRSGSKGSRRRASTALASSKDVPRGWPSPLATCR